MKLIIALSVVTILPSFVEGQKIISLTSLEDSVKETSGLIYLNQKLITHNDSGGEPALYEIDSITGKVTRRVFINNATNTDWEDICHDSAFIYIGDFGNDGSREDLKIYRLSISNYLNTVNDTVTVDTIQFNYADQTNFTASQFSTNFDAEALIPGQDSLYIFTKNWGDYHTNIYSLPKEPGTYHIARTDRINAQGLITGAAFNPVSKTVLLIGYTLFTPIIIEINDFTFNGFSNKSINRYQISPPPDYSYQIEGIAHLRHDQYCITAEEFTSLKAALYMLNLDYLSGLESKELISVSIFPNPATDVVYINDYDEPSTVEIYDLLGNLQRISNDQQINVSGLRKGMYILNIKNSRKDTTITNKLIIE